VATYCSLCCDKYITIIPNGHHQEEEKAINNKKKKKQTSSRRGEKIEQTKSKSLSALPVRVFFYCQLF
jgi:hypothetical protein